MSATDLTLFCVAALAFASTLVMRDIARHIRKITIEFRAPAEKEL